MGVKIVVVTLAFIGLLPTIWCTVNVVGLEMNSLLQMQQGLGWPHTLNVAERHAALLKLTRSVVNQDSCYVTTPTGQTFEVSSPPSNRFESWSDTCGVRVRDVQLSDEGRWRLTSAHHNESLTGWVEVNVRNITQNYTGGPIHLEDGRTYTEIELSTLENAYCVVTQPFSEGNLVAGDCKVTLDRATRAIQGNWHVLLGIPGQVSEMQVDRAVAVDAEQLDVGFIYDGNKLNLYCNILHTSKNITFCRFQKTSSAYGYNVIDGLSDGVHSYYGEGFLKGQCGITIENSTPQDIGTWRCSLGVQQWVDQQIVQQTPLQALIRVEADHSQNVNMLLSETRETESTVFVQENSQFSISCRAAVSLMYCWFQHPNGSQFTPVPRVEGDTAQLFWTSGNSLQMGQCEITFMHGTAADSGNWTCHMGPRNQIGLEITDAINVRVTGPLAANKKDVATNVGELTTLYCHSSNGNRVLQYCRFMTPNYNGFNIDSSVTEENAILNRFYFTPARSLDYGDCSLTISSVQEEDIGEWTCAALVDDDTVESRDTILVYMNEEHTVPAQTGLSRAGIVGMVIGISVLAVVLAGALWWKRGRRALSNSSVAYQARMSGGTASTSSDSSQNQITLNTSNPF